MDLCVFFASAICTFWFASFAESKKGRYESMIDSIVDEKLADHAHGSLFACLRVE